ncbi:MAG: diguanylate cyclase domain-containing protein [bacterium]
MGKDPARLIFEDELTGLYNRRYLHHHLQFKIPWNDPEDHPLSLIMIDVDHFKEINDSYGHNMGDEALVWIAHILKEVSGDEAIPVRYAGDEFVVLLPFQDKKAAFEVAERMLRRVQEQPFHSSENDRDMPITLSMGIATTLMNSQGGKGLIQKADTALYYAKKTGRNRLADADDIDLDEVLTKTALYHLNEIKITGRKRQLAQVAEAFKKFSQWQSQFLVIEGSPGMGKTELLRAISTNLVQQKALQVSVRGFPQEMFRPYYLLTDILISILTQLYDSGPDACIDLNNDERSYLAHILPFLGETKEKVQEKDQKSFREGIFTTLLRFIPKVLNNRPLILFIDDLHYSDEATLLLLRRLILRGEVPLFVCATSTEACDTRERQLSLQRFYESYHQELNIVKVTLTPLNEVDAIDHMHGLFADLSPSKEFVQDLMEITQGNPLFFNEILRKLVQDQKIVMAGQKWIMRPLEKGYLPRSLDEIVCEKIAALDKENRELLEHFSAIGEDVSMSSLVGSSGKIENNVLEFIDQAMNQGLISTEFKLNDEMLHFLSKRILQITYGGIEETRRQEMHERIGTYQETLYNQKLLHSAATLAYHFKRSADQERARKYEQVTASWNTKIFNAKEALDYKDDIADDFPIAEEPLDSAGMGQVPALLRQLLGTINKIKLYPQGSKSVTKAITQLKEALDRITENADLLTITLTEENLLINEQELDIAEFRPVAKDFTEFLNHLELKGMAFCREVSEQELVIVIEGFCRFKSGIIAPAFWKHFCTENGLTHIKLKQVRYTRADDQDADHGDDAGLVEEGEHAAQPDLESLSSSFTLHAEDQNLDQAELDQVLDVTRSLLRTFKNLRLYPQESKAVSDSVAKLMTALTALLSTHQTLSFSRIKDTLLVNGIKVEATDFKEQMNSLFKFLDEAMIHSLTFMQGLTDGDLNAFLGALRRIWEGKADEYFWGRFAVEARLAGLLVNRHLYEMLEGIPMPAVGMEPEEEKTKEEETQEEKSDVEETFEDFLKVAQERLTDYLLEDDKRQVKKTVTRLFEEFQGREFLIRKRIIDICQGTFDTVNLDARYQLCALLSDPLPDIMGSEKEEEILLKIVTLFKQMSVIFIQFAEYPPASRLLVHLHRWAQKIRESGEDRYQNLTKVLDFKLEPQVERLIEEDLKSSSASKQKKAVQLLGSLGDAALPLLVNIVKKGDEYRVRRLATSLLEKIGPKAGLLLKRQLVIEINPEERVRILEVIDSLTHDLKGELPLLLGDRSSRVQQAAFELAERLNEKYVVDLLMNCARNQSMHLATAAVRCLGRLKIRATSGELLSLLKSAKKEELIIACCKALGELQDPGSVEPLAHILERNRPWAFWKKRNDEVRSAAAVALAQLSDPKGDEILASLAEDPDPRIRQIAKGVAENNNRSSHPS